MNTTLSSATEATTPLFQKPAFKTFEDENETRVLIALPGVAKENLKLTLNQAVLQIEAKRRSSIEEKQDDHAKSTKDLVYALSLQLSNRLDGTKVEASLTNGVLTLNIPCREEAKPRDIFVN